MSGGKGGPVTVKIEIHDGRDAVVITSTREHGLEAVLDEVYGWARAAAGIDGAPHKPAGAP